MLYVGCMLLLCTESWCCAGGPRMSVMMPETTGALGTFPSSPLSFKRSEVIAEANQNDDSASLCRTSIGYDNIWVTKNRGKSFSALGEAQVGCAILQKLHEACKPKTAKKKGIFSRLRWGSKGRSVPHKSRGNSCFHRCNPFKLRALVARQESKEHSRRHHQACKEERAFAQQAASHVEHLTKSRCESFYEKMLHTQSNLDSIFNEVWLEPGDFICLNTSSFVWLLSATLSFSPWWFLYLFQMRHGSQ